MVDQIITHDKGKGRAVDSHVESTLPPLGAESLTDGPVSRLDQTQPASTGKDYTDDYASDSDDQSSHYFLSSTHRQSSLPFHQNPLPVPVQSTSSRPASPFRSSYTAMRSSSSRPASPRSNQVGLSSASLRSTSPALANGKEVTRSVGTGGPIAPLPDRKYVSRHSIAPEPSTDPLHHRPSHFAPSPPPAYSHSHHLSTLAATPLDSTTTDPSSTPRSERMSTNSKRPSPASTRGIRSHSISRSLPRLDRFADPNEHWLSEDEGANMISAGVRRAVPPAHAHGNDGHDTIDSKPHSPAPSPTHSINHQPASNFSSPPSVLATPRSSSPVDFGLADPTLATTLAELALAIPCKACRKPLRDPTTLGCGHSICLACSLPPPIAFIRPSLDGVSATESLFAKNPSTPLPATLLAASTNTLHATTASGTRLVARASAVGPGGVRGRMTCPVKDCEYKDRLSTALVEPKVDYVLQKVLHLLRRDVPDFDLEIMRMQFEADNEMEIDAEDDLDRERLERANSASSGDGEEKTLTEEDLKRGRRSTDFKTTKRQRASADSPIIPSALFDIDAVPSTFLPELQSELECQVCVQLFHEPLTTPCGHTFCSKCLARSLDHSDKCPLCRADFPSFDFFQHQPNNLTTQSIITAAFPALAAERKASIEAEERANSMDTPIFVCTLAWPNLPTYIHIFEPRYRLMMRRVMDGDRQFGMVLPSRNDGGLSEYGTMLQVQSCNMIEDGRSIVETVGTYRFRVLEKGTYDGYTVGRIERVDDISQEQENELERVALARNQPAASSPSTRRAPLSLSLPLSQNTSPSGSPPPELPVELSTAELMTVCLEFVQTLRSGSAPWVLQRLNNTIGPMPTNPSDFSFWMAEVMPVDDHVKAALLQITSPRERLRLLVFWIEQFRSSWWFVAGCSLM